MKKIIQFFDSRINKLCAMVLAGALALGGYNWICWSSLSASDWATWFGSIGTLTAVIVAAFAIYAQGHNALMVERLRRDEEEARTLLSLKYLAREIRSMIRVAGNQIDQEGNEVFYINISDEFDSMYKMLEQLPMERIALRGCMEEWHTLRRCANELSKMYDPQPTQGDGFYFANRNRISKLEDRCSWASASIGKLLEEFAPELYVEHENSLNRM